MITPPQGKNISSKQVLKVFINNNKTTAMVATLISQCGPKVKPAEFSLQDQTVSAIKKAIKQPPIIAALSLQKHTSPQYIIAAIAFRIFCLDALPMYLGDIRLKQLINYHNQYLKQAEAGESFDTIIRAKKVFQQFLQAHAVANSGLNFKNIVAEYKSDLETVNSDEGVVSFSKMLDGEEFTIVYNTSGTGPRDTFVLLQNRDVYKTNLNIIDGYRHCKVIGLNHCVLNGNAISYIKTYLNPLQMLILKT